MGRHADGEPRAAWTAPGRRLPWRRAGAGAASLVVTLAFTSFAAVGSAGAAAATVATCATLSTGAHGAAVATIQRLVGTPADGDFGPLTAAALARWQTTHHLRGTGRVDAATWRALPTTVATQACGQPVRGSRGVGASCPTLHTGSVGPAVRVLQAAVRATTDGELGPLTRAAVQAAQRRLKLPVTRSFGPATWAGLGLTGTPACVTAPVAPTASPGSGTSSAGANASPSSSPSPSPSPSVSARPSPSSSPSPAPKPKLPADWPAQLVIRTQVAKLAATLPAAPGTTTDPVALKMLAFATKQTGKPYAWGGAGPKAYDCSGLVMASYRAAGLTLPRVAADQYTVGSAVPLDQARQGDLVFYASDVTRPATIYHVAIYLGAGKVFDAPYTGAFVGSRPLWTHDLLPIAVRPTGLLTLPVKAGATGWTVTQLQAALDRLGAAIPVDGAFGPATQSAVKQWQSTHHLDATGVVDVTTWLTLH